MPWDSYINKERGALPFCPGCGHHAIVKALDKALVELQWDPAKTVIVTDIGCVGISDMHFITSAFHGLHGRSLTYATGLKLADPDLHVIVLVGDGGVGIGGAHFLNAARRNMDIKVILFNNLNFGMTGGEHSVTTPEGGVTNTTPLGNIENALDICGTLAPSKPSFLARTTSLDTDLGPLMKTALTTHGFALLEVWEYCMAYYAQKNKMTGRGLDTLIENAGLKKGIISRSNRPAYGESGAKGEIPKQVGLAVAYSSKLEHETGILVAGGAGQKIASSATNLCRGAILSGLYATQKDDYPITVMTGHSIAEVIISPKPIEFTGLSKPAYALVLSPEGVARSKALLQAMDENGIIIADGGIQLPPVKAKVISLSLSEHAKSIDRLTVASVAFGALIKASGIFSLEAFVKGMEIGQKPEHAKKNVEAAKLGYGLI